MVNLKTKFDKHAYDNEKRRKSINEKEKAKSNQSLIIKQALSNNTLSNCSSKKIIFNDNEIECNFEMGKNILKNGKSTLFDGSDSEAEVFEIKEKSQFIGKNGFELLNLQSTYGNDERFKIDERFLKDDEEGDALENKFETNDTCRSEEKAEQLKILESVLGTPIGCPTKEKKETKKISEMVRYDTSNKSHEIYEISSEKYTDKLSSLKKRGEGRKRARNSKEMLPEVTKEKFYDVSSEIKNCFKEKKEVVGQFSLLQTYGLTDIEKNKEREEIEKLDSDDCVNEEKKNCDLIEEYKIAQNKAVLDKPKIQETAAIARGIQKEKFFFGQNDPRFTEGLDFINKMNSEEARNAGENYDKTRKKLKEILRLHLKKQTHKKNPFKNKIGGMNKKQLASSRNRNSKMNCNKKK